MFLGGIIVEELMGGILRLWFKVVVYVVVVIRGIVIRGFLVLLFGIVI